jgi:hypothetical protein
MQGKEMMERIGENKTLEKIKTCHRDTETQRYTEVHRERQNLFG